MKLWYPSVERVSEYNHIILTLVKVKKSDRPELLNRSKLSQVIIDCEEDAGDIYDKAVILLEGIIKFHPFASGNRRTAFFTAKDFLLMNGAKLSIGDDPANARVLLGIREGFYTSEETKEWLKHGKIKEFRR